ncbi:MAG: zinc-dependent peptidase [Candidatus Thiothrix singaporensis]|uniref:Zinc-dependent peptidase n=1 Tax=Candidatus Thiothrix singaporensis TaxID=2799669 RepID=A0A7L6AY63_9GAMM|nr:MAG: zinc-dependent peptidase [Candidatus Thiothrix singaporensis]
MPESSWLLLLSLTVAAIAAFAWPHYRLRKAVDAPFPAAWREIVARNLPVYQRMPASLQRQLEQRIQQFLHQKYFTGCNGLEITDEIRVTIAADACLLILNRNTGVYPDLRYILVYPDGFRVTAESSDAAGLVSTRWRGLSGESWSNGKVILSWADVMRGNHDFTDGANVALHEFAHQLDYEDATNGAPLLGSAARYQRWAEVLGGEFAALQQAAFQGEATLLNTYGATNPAEFFAVATEHFFEQPQQLAEQHPALFAELQRYYRINPAEWRPEAEPLPDWKPGRDMGRT